MPATKTIYLDDEALLSLQEHRNKNPEFNLSAFIGAMLLKDRIAKEKNPDIILLEITQIENQINSLKAKVDHMKEVHRKLMIEKEHKETEEHEMAIKEQRDREDKIRFHIGTLMDIWGFDMDKSRIIAEEFMDVPKESRPKEIRQFMLNMGYIREEKKDDKGELLI
jgi:ribosomal protein S6